MVQIEDLKSQMSGLKPAFSGILDVSGHGVSYSKRDQNSSFSSTPGRNLVSRIKGLEKEIE